MAQREKLADTILSDMKRTIAKLRVQRALRHKVPLIAEVVCQIDEEILVLWKIIVNTEIGGWLGPFILHEIDVNR